jgi:DNA-binding response OmpR family regulator
MKAKTRITTGGLGASAAQGTLPRVLVVDDEEDVRELVQDLLSGSCAVETAASFEEARKKLAASRYDLAILDLMGVHGHDLLLEFAARTHCIVLTASARSDLSHDRARAAGAVLYLSKEEIDDLERRVHDVLAARTGHRPGVA